MAWEGTIAPTFALADLHGHEVRSEDLWSSRPVLLVFYKVNCPTCQLALPRVEPLHKAYGEHLTVVGISQNDVRSTRPFVAEKGTSFVQLIDQAPYDVSRAYGLAHVPTFVLIEPGGRIARYFAGWDRDAMNALSAMLAAEFQLPPVVASTPADGLPSFKPG